MNKHYKTVCVRMTGSDEMDQRPSIPINTLPIKCRHCGLPDLDFVSTPYLLAKGVAAPIEISCAQRGNFLVRERVRRILEVTVPDACTFYQTADVKSKTPLAWWLAVPNQKLQGVYPTGSHPFCPVCHLSNPDGIEGIPLGRFRKKMKKFDSCGIDIFKSLPWIGGWFFRRELYFSVRLEQLLKRARVKASLVRSLAEFRFRG